VQVLYSLRIDKSASGGSSKNGSSKMTTETVAIEMEDCIGGKLQYKYSETLPTSDEEVIVEEWVSLATMYN